jgi:hypothetical protein
LDQTLYSYTYKFSGKYFLYSASNVTFTAFIL